MSPDDEGSRPGSEVSLIALYDAVPATEEVDLREEWEREEARSVRELLSTDEGTGAADDQGEEPVDPLTDSQVFGLVEHILGAELIDDDAEGDRPDR